MHSLSAQNILRAWECGISQRPTHRALTLLTLACPDMTYQDLAALTIGQRDALLLDLREMTLGPRIEGFTDCPRCKERIEVALSAAQIREIRGDALKGVNKTMEFFHDGSMISFRLPDSTDLLAIEECDPEMVRNLIVQRCLGGTTVHNASTNGSEPSPQLVKELAQRIIQADPLAEVVLDLRCPACDNCWYAMLDIATFLWEEIAAHARALMRDVHTLARAYGWREADILSLSPDRRQFYLDMVAQ